MSDWYRIIETWDEDDLLDFLKNNDESDELELKSSKMPLDKLINELGKAASAFWNAGSGRGIFIGGADKKGNIDGGFPMSVGRGGKQKLDEWVDQGLPSKVEPIAPHAHAIRLISPKSSGSNIKPDHVVLVISFGQSHVAPHMAYDGKYYIRLGAHSDPATHFLVEAIRARRNAISPVLRGIMRINELRGETIELVILALNDARAVDVSITFDPFPKFIEKQGEKHIARFPVRVPVIDSNNPFKMDVAVWMLIKEFFGIDPIKLLLEFYDLQGKKFQYSQLIHPDLDLPVLRMSSPDELVEIFKTMREEFKAIRGILEDRLGGSINKIF